MGGQVISLARQVHYCFCFCKEKHLHGKVDLPIFEGRKEEMVLSLLAYSDVW